MRQSIDVWPTVHSRITATEGQWLIDLARGICAEIAQPVFFNIGVSWGCSLHCLRAGCDDARLVGIDIRDRPVVAAQALRAELVLGDSRVYHEHFAGPIHLLFVDGGHSFDCVTADIAGWVPKLAVGGVVAFHDYGGRQPKHCQVREAVDAWLAKRAGHWEDVPAVGSMKAFRFKG